MDHIRWNRRFSNLAVEAGLESLKEHSSNLLHHLIDVFGAKDQEIIDKNIVSDNKNCPVIGMENWHETSVSCRNGLVRTK